MPLRRIHSCALQSFDLKNLLQFEGLFKAQDRTSLRAVQPRTQLNAGMQIPRNIFGPVYTYIFGKYTHSVEASMLALENRENDMWGQR